MQTYLQQLQYPLPPTHTHIAALAEGVSIALLAGESLGTKHYLPLSTTIYHYLPLSTTIYHIQCKTHHSKIQRGNLKLYHMSVYCILPYSGRQSYKSSHLVHHAVFRFTVHKCIGQVEQSGATLTNIIQIQSHGHPVL